MKDYYPKTENEPRIVRYVQTHREGISSYPLNRHAIGYIIKGSKHIYHGDQRRVVSKGDLYYMPIGHHYTEDIPEQDKNFEQIVFYYDSSDINKILNHLSLNYKLTITNNHNCQNCDRYNDVIFPAWNILKNFFSSVNQYIKDDASFSNSTSEQLKIMELIFLILTNDDCCIKSKILKNIDTMSVNFEKVIQDNIFNNISIEELASKCNRSLTSFKKEFRKHFSEPPHKWFIRQRLMHARLLLISTNKSISEIGIESNFPNTSHFIKLFRKEFGSTPVAYRHSAQRSYTPTTTNTGTNFVQI